MFSGSSNDRADVPLTVIIATKRGERLSRGLPDGTRLVLAPGSTLRHSSRYGSDERVVSLEGEAAFTVAHDAKRPFTVRTTRGTIRDLGTRFRRPCLRGG